MDDGMKTRPKPMNHAVDWGQHVRTLRDGLDGGPVQKSGGDWVEGRYGFARRVKKTKNKSPRHTKACPKCESINIHFHLLVFRPNPVIHDIKWDAKRRRWYLLKPDAEGWLPGDMVAQCSYCGAQWDPYHKWGRIRELQPRKPTLEVVHDETWTREA